MIVVHLSRRTRTRTRRRNKYLNAPSAPPMSTTCSLRWRARGRGLNSCASLWRTLRFPAEQGLEHSLWFSSPQVFTVSPTEGEATEAENRWLVFENSFSPAVGSPRRPIRKSLTLTEKFNASGYSEKRCFRGALSNSTRHSALIWC